MLNITELLQSLDISYTEEVIILHILWINIFGEMFITWLEKTYTNC